MKFNYSYYLFKISIFFFAEDRRWLQSLWNWSCGRLRPAIWVLDIKPWCLKEQPLDLTTEPFFQTCNYLTIYLTSLCFNKNILSQL